jgi:hypothetical protein
MGVSISTGLCATVVINTVGVNADFALFFTHGVMLDVVVGKAF